MKAFSNTEILTLTAFQNLEFNATMEEYKTSVRVVHDVLKQLEQLPELKNNKIILR